MAEKINARNFTDGFHVKILFPKLNCYEVVDELS